MAEMYLPQQKGTGLFWKLRLFSINTYWTAQSTYSPLSCFVFITSYSLWVITIEVMQQDLLNFNIEKETPRWGLLPLLSNLYLVVKFRPVEQLALNRTCSFHSSPLHSFGTLSCHEEGVGHSCVQLSGCPTNLPSTWVKPPWIFQAEE